MLSMRESAHCWQACFDRKLTSLMHPSIRSALFVPANRPARIDKALAAGADTVIVDLEDAVPPEDKIQARTFLAASMAPERPVVVRINGADTPWFRDDCAILHLPGLAGVMLPKAERIDEGFLFSCAGVGVPVMPIIESALGLNNVQVIARARGVQCLVFGSIDFQLDLGITEETDELLPYRAQIVLASRLAGIAPPIDGVSTALDAPDSLRDDCNRARRLGFGGKLCIHPRQVEIVNQCFAPSEEEVAWAHRVLDAAAQFGGAAVAVDGRMVDRPVMMRAQAIVHEADERALRGVRPSRN